MVFGLLKTAAKVGKWGLRGAWGLTKAAWGPLGFGLAGMGPGIGKRLLVPGLLIGGYGAMSAARGLLGAPFSMNSPHAAWGYTPGAYAPYQDYPMEFSSIPRNLDMGARGSMLFALHNQRKA